MSIRAVVRYLLVVRATKVISYLNFVLSASVTLSTVTSAMNHHVSVHVLRKSMRMEPSTCSESQCQIW